jgi:hypothetical protein
MVHRAFAEYKDKQCGDKTMKCTSYSGWSNTGIVINLIIYSLLLLAVVGFLINLVGELSSPKSPSISNTQVIKLVAFPLLIIILIIIIVGQSLLIKQNKLSCDNSYVCLDNFANINTNSTGYITTTSTTGYITPAIKTGSSTNNRTIKFSAVISIILSCLILIASLIFLSQ